MSRAAGVEAAACPTLGDAMVMIPPPPVKASQGNAPKPRSTLRLLRHQLGLRRGQRMAFAGHMGDHVWQALAVATTMSEGGVELPRSLPGRIVYASFLFLLLVMLSMVTANTGERGQYGGSAKLRGQWLECAIRGRLSGPVRHKHARMFYRCMHGPAAAAAAAVLHQSAQFRLSIA